MQIKPGRLHALAIAIPQPDTHVCLVGTLIFTEANIPVNFKQAFIDFGNCTNRRCDVSEPSPHSVAQIPSCLHLVSSIVKKAMLVSLCSCLPAYQFIYQFPYSRYA